LPLTLADSLGLWPGLGPHQTVDIEARMPPGENPLSPLWAEKLLPDKKRQDRSAEQLGQSRVIQAGDLMEDAAVIHSALGHQEMEVRVKVDPIPKGLDRGDDA